MELRAKYIAEMLGVSTETVSLVLNNKRGVGDQKRQEIIEKIRELGCDYLLKDIPVTNGNIGFVVYKTIGKIVDESPFFNYILEGLNSSLTDYGYNLSFVYMNRSTPLEVQEMQLRSSDCKDFLYLELRCSEKIFRYLLIQDFLLWYWILHFRTVM